jgi:hypothetical protein
MSDWALVMDIGNYKSALDNQRRHSKRKIHGFRLPSLFGYSTFSFNWFYFDNGGWTSLGTNGWYLQICIGPPIWELHWSIKLK